MFTVGGWTPLSEVAQTIFTGFATKSFFVQPEGPHKAAAAQIWKFLKEAKQVAVLTPSGGVVLASRYLIATPDEDYDLSSNDHINVYLGSVGSAYNRRSDQLDWDTTQLFYGPFLGCPVLCDTNEFRSYLSGRLGFPADGSFATLSPPDLHVAAQLTDERRGKGRPKLHDGAIERSIHLHFPIKYKDGTHFSIKKAALIAEAQAWALDVFRQEISVETARTYLAPLWNKLQTRK